MECASAIAPPPGSGLKAFCRSVPRLEHEVAGDEGDGAGQGDAEIRRAVVEMGMDSRHHSQICRRGRSRGGTCIFESPDIRTAFIENPDSVGALVKPDRIVGPAADAIDKPHGVSGNR